MIRPPPRSTRTHSFPTRRSSDPKSTHRHPPPLVCTQLAADRGGGNALPADLALPSNRNPDPNPISAARPKESSTSQEGEFFIWRPLGPTRAGAFFGPASEPNVRSGILMLLGRASCREKGC